MYRWSSPVQLQQYLVVSFDDTDKSLRGFGTPAIDLVGTHDGAYRAFGDCLALKAQGSRSQHSSGYSAASAGRYTPL